MSEHTSDAADKHTDRAERVGDVSIHQTLDNVIDATVTGIEIEGGDLNVAGDLTIVQNFRSAETALLARYLRILAVIAAPYAEADGVTLVDPLLDVWGEWNLLVEALRNASRLAGSRGAPFGLIRLMPPTLEQLQTALAVPGDRAYQIVHFAGCAGTDGITLENHLGHAAPVPLARLVEVLAASEARLVVLNADTLSDVAGKLVRDTGVQAVVGIQTPAPDEVIRQFLRTFYNRLLVGASVKTAFAAAQSALRDLPDGPATQAILAFADGVPDLHLPLPPIRECAEKPLISREMPFIIAAPANVGFVDRAADLTTLARRMPETAMRLAAVYGMQDIGKSWLAAEYITRFGWQFRDGVLWLKATATTPLQDLIMGLARLLLLSYEADEQAVLTEAREKKFLIVVDGFEALPEETVAALGEFMTRFDTTGGSRLLLISHHPPENRRGLNPQLTHHLREMPDDGARALIRNLAERYEVWEDIEPQIEAFTQRTLGLPWLIKQGVRLVKAPDGGLDFALNALETFASGVYEPVEEHVGRGIRALSEARPDAPFQTLRRLAQLPDSFRLDLIMVVSDADYREHIRTLARLGLLRREGRLFGIPPVVSHYLNIYYPLTPDEQAQIDDLLAQVI